MSPSLVTCIPVDEETIFGIASRCHRLSSHTSSKQTLQDLFGSVTASPAAALPMRLEHLAIRLGQNDISARDLVQRHTLLPYFRPFASSKTYDRVMASMAGSTTGGAKVSLGWVPSRLGASDQIRYCPECARYDREQCGFSTWRRCHQLPGVLFCPEHLNPLHESCYLAERLHRHQLFLPDRLAVPFLVPAEGLKARQVERLQQVASLSLRVLLNGSDGALPSSAEQRRVSYLTQLQEIGLSSPNGRVLQQDFQDAFMHFWADLGEISPFDKLVKGCSGDHSWLAALVRKERGARHPLKHVLLIGFLESHRGQLSAASEGDVAKKVPSCCIENESFEAVDRAEQLIQLMDQRRISIRKAAAILGVTPNTALRLVERKGRTPARRPKKVTSDIRAGIRNALGQGDPLEDIANRFSVSIPTVSRILGGDVSLQALRQDRLHTQRQCSAQAAFLAVRRDHPTFGIKSLRECVPADYAWLLRHDLHWLRAHQPEGMPATKGVNRCRVDWDARDRRLALAVDQAAKEIISAPGKPVRISVSELGRRTNSLTILNKCLDRLLLTKQCIETAKESVTDFQIRRLEWWQTQAQNENEADIPQWRLLRAAGLRRLPPRSTLNVPSYSFRPKRRSRA